MKVSCVRVVSCEKTTQALYRIEFQKAKARGEREGGGVGQLIVCQVLRDGSGPVETVS